MAGVDFVRLAAEFDAAWASETPPQLEAFLERVVQRQRTAVFRELLRRELTHRAERNERPEKTEYLNRFPQYAAQIEAVFSEEPPPASTVELKGKETDPGAAPTLGWNEPAAESPPDRDALDIPGYELLENLGAGGMGLVVKARHLALNRLVAIKIPRGRHVSDPTARERFLREAQAVAKFRHPNICPIHEVGEQGGRPYIVMGYIEGQTLRDWAAQNRPSAHQAAQVVMKLAQAVGYAHEHGVVHRDIKPGNVMMDAEWGEPVLMDFGLAKQRDGELLEPPVDDAQASDSDAQLPAGLTQMGAVLGTPAYMSPEQAGGRVDEVGPASDVYALGVVLYELLCGRPPFTATSRDELLRKVQSEKPPPPSTVAPHLHRDLETICLKAIAKAPRDRYASAGALAEDLRRFCQGEAILARREGMAEKLWRRVRRHKMATVLALLVLLALPTAAFLGLRWRHQSALTELRQQFELALDKTDWNAAHYENANELLTRLGEFDADNQTDDRRRLAEAFALSIERMVRRARNEPVQFAAAKKLIELLALADAQRAVPLERMWREFQSRMRVVGLVQPPDFADIHQVFPEGVRHDEQSRTFTLQASPPRPVLLRSAVGSQGNVQIEATFDDSWKTMREVGLLIDATDRGSYVFGLRVARGDAAADGKASGNPVKDLDDARRLGRRVELYVSRGRRPLAIRFIESGELGDGDLKLRAQRQGNKLSMQVNSLPPAVIHDLFASSGEGVFGLRLQEGLRVRAVRMQREVAAQQPSPLQQGDRLFVAGKFDEAQEYYQQQQEAETPDAEIGQEARFKEAMCLVRRNRHEEAAALFDRLRRRPGERWPLLASAHFWQALRAAKKPFAQAEDAKYHVAAHYPATDLVRLVPGDLLLEMFSLRQASFGATILWADDRSIAYFDKSAEVQQLLGVDLYTRLNTLGALGRALGHARGSHLEQRFAVLERALKLVPEHKVWYRMPDDVKMIVEQYAEACIEKATTGPAVAVVQRILEGAPPGRRKNQRLLVVLARLYAAGEQGGKAIPLLDECMDGTAPYHDHCEAGLLLGFVYEALGRNDDATAAWKRGSFHGWAKARNAPATAAELGKTALGLGPILDTLMLAGLSGEKLTAQELDVFFRVFAAHFAGGELPLARLFRGDALRLAVPDRVLSDMFFQMWRGPRGRDLARRIAFRKTRPIERARQPLVLALYQLYRQQAMTGMPNEQQDEHLWEVSQYFVERGIERAFTPVQLGLILATWKGQSFSWALGLNATPPETRGRLAYIFGHRYRFRRQPQQALQFFRTALADAKATSNSSLMQSAEFEIKRLTESK